ncbi:BOS complex subunit ncln-like [Hydractinia symbiolongicarpus]|uniref:BOS complex subunit ncln-like n=1 Tax=Hydractinia symbiolongicarpus TaxID=13093 RepID=UPI00254C7F43|nr:BOS complex subunit ncln-like [Hydractinia symbiolongicarpus]
MIGDTENIFEFLRSMPSSVCFLMVIPILLMTAPSVYGAHDFPVFRMQQFDLSGVKHGSRGAAINLEARSLSSENLIRRCAVVRATELSMEQLQKAIEDGLSALLILIPPHLDRISLDELKKFEALEQELLTADLPIPVYFAHEKDRIRTLYEEIASAVTGDASSALRAMTNVASANSFHLVTDGGESKAMNDFPIISIQGKLTGQGLEDQLPTLAIVTHYDAFSVVPKLSKGAGSGVVALLEIARLFSKLYDRQSTQPKFNILFLLAGGGKFNYQGTKKWIEDNVESSEISLLAEAEYVLCIDAIGQGTNLNIHVSKPPKDGSQGYALVNELKKVTNELFPDSTFSMIHKKVNLADDLLAWEHERFSLRRLPAGTLSHRDKPSQVQGSIFDRKITNESLWRNIKILSEGLARHVFNLSEKSYSSKLEIFSGDLSLDKDHINSWIERVTSEPRSQQLISKDHRLLTAFEESLGIYLKEVRRIVTKADKKDPEFIFYDVFIANMSVYSVKPALFDLFLALGIASYLGLVYLVVENFHLFTDLLPKPISNGKVLH